MDGYARTLRRSTIHIQQQPCGARNSTSTANRTLSTDDLALPVVQVDARSQVCTVPSHFQLLTVDRTERHVC